jgi:S1-C subfamily serine protease
VKIPQKKKNEQRFGLALLEVEPDSPAAASSLLPGDILLGVEGNPFASADDLYATLTGNGPRLLRLEFLRGDYTRVRRVTVQIGADRAAGSTRAA